MRATQPRRSTVTATRPTSTDAEAGKVFAFFVYSKDQGFGGSQFGNNDADRTVISSAVIESTDGGVSWSQLRLITDVTKSGTSKTSKVAGDVRSCTPTRWATRETCHSQA